jgi:hypothetical protein
MTHKKENKTTLSDTKKRNKTDKNGHSIKRIECLCNDEWKVEDVEWKFEDIEWNVEDIEWNVEVDYFPSCICQKTEIKE